MERNNKSKLILSLLPVFLIFTLLFSTCKNKSSDAPGTVVSAVDKLGPEYIGRESCKECHEREYELYQGSDHDLAMDHATDETVLADFNTSQIIHGVILCKISTLYLCILKQ